MSWVTIIWSMGASACLTLGTMYFLVWCRDRRSWSYLSFFVLAAGVIGMAAGEFGAMFAQSPAEYGAAVRWGHLAYGFIAVGSLGFVHFYFGTGNRWLLWSALGLRLLAIVANFSTGLNLHIGAIQSLQRVNFLGEPVSMLGVWTANPWVRLGQIAALAQFVYVADASLRLWRTGGRESRRRAVMVGGPLAFFILFASAQAGLVAAGMLRMPIIVSFPFLAVLLAMGLELSRDVLRAGQMGQELRESEERLNLATEAAGVGVWMWNIARNLVWGSEKWLHLFGFAPGAAVTFEDVIQRIDPDDRKNVEREVRRALEERSDYTGEFRVILPDGTQRWLVSRGRAYLDAKGKPVRMLGTAIDITERKKTEEEDHNSHELMAAVFNSVPGLLYLYREDGQIVQWNKQHEVMTGFTAEELLNRRARDWYDDEDLGTFDRAIHTIFSEGYADAEMKLIHKNGERVPYFLTGSKLTFHGKPHLVGVAIDISARKQAEELLRESEERMTLAAEAAGLGVWVWSIPGNQVWGSERWLSLFGFSRDAAVSFEMVMQRIHPDDRGTVEGKLQGAMEERGDYIGEFRVILPDGTKRWLVVRGKAYRDAHGKPVRMMGAAIDITDRKQAEQKIGEQRNELARVVRVSTMSQLASSLAHELNQPLGAILRNAEAAEMFLQDPSPDLDEVRAILADIRSDDQRAGEVIDRMRGFMKRREFELRRLDLNLLATEVITLMRPDTELRHVRLVLETDPALPPVLGDQVQLQQVFLNLLLNAMDALKDDPTERRLITMSSRLAGETVEVAVSDTGHGIPADRFPRVFEPFFTSKSNGLGMGLPISRSIIEAHGGRLWAENNTDGGATFTFSLPVAGVEEGRGAGGRGAEEGRGAGDEGRRSA